MVYSASHLRNLKAAVELGSILREAIPAISQEYREGLYLKEISAKHYVASKYAVNQQVARLAVYYALGGWNYNKEIPTVSSYEGLIEKTELETLVKQHQKNHGANMAKVNVENGIGLMAKSKAEFKRLSGQGGWQSYLNGNGVHALSSEDHSKYGEAGGTEAYNTKAGMFKYSKGWRTRLQKQAAKELVRQKKGVHGKSHEDHVEYGKLGYATGIAHISEKDHSKNSRKGGRNSFKKGEGVHGLTAEQNLQNRIEGMNALDSEFYTPDEIEYIALQREADRPYKELAKELNLKFHDGLEIRTADALKSALHKRRKKENNQASFPSSVGHSPIV